MGVTACFFDGKENENQDPALCSAVPVLAMFEFGWTFPTDTAYILEKTMRLREHRETEGTNYGDERLVLLEQELRPKAEAHTATQSPWLLHS